MRSKKELLDALASARANLVLEHPFIGLVALSLPMSLDDTLDPPTAATDGKEVRFCPAFIAPLTKGELMFLVAHECFHPMLEHTHRRAERDGEKWNIAGDIVINELLTQEGIGTMPEGGIRNSALYAQGNGTTEGVYNILPKGGRRGWQDCKEGDSSDEAAAREWKLKVAQAAQGARMMGKLSKGMDRFVNGLLSPKVRWQEELRTYLENSFASERTWARANRRFAPYGMYLPSHGTLPSMSAMVVAIDCSGSVSDGELAQFAAEIAAIKQDLSPSTVHVLYFDTEVCHSASFGQDEPLVIELKGGGGTAFSPIFSYIEEHDIQPSVVVVLTDLCCSDFGPEPEYPVLWACVAGGKTGDVPFGRVVEVCE